MTPTGGPRRCAASIASDPAPQVAVNLAGSRNRDAAPAAFTRGRSALASIPGHGVGLYGVPLT